MSHDHRKVHWEPKEHTKSKDGASTHAITTNRHTDNKRRVATTNTTLGLLEFSLSLTCRMFTEPPPPPPSSMLGLGLMLDLIQ